MTRSEMTEEVMRVLDPQLRRDLEEGRGVQEILKTLAIVSASIMTLGDEVEIHMFCEWILRALKIHALMDEAETKSHRLH